MLPSKMIPTNSPSRFTTGLAGIAADDVGGADEVERRGEIELPFPLFPNCGQFERFLVLMGLGVFECAAQRRGPGNLLARFRVPLGLTKSQAKREGGIRIDARAIYGEPGVGDFAVRLALGLIHLLLEGLADAARGRVD